jgi:hypothetical protein
MGVGVSVYAQGNASRDFHIQHHSQRYANKPPITSGDKPSEKRSHHRSATKFHLVTDDTQNERLHCFR